MKWHFKVLKNKLSIHNTQQKKKKKRSLSKRNETYFLKKKKEKRKETLIVKHLYLKKDQRKSEKRKEYDTSQKLGSTQNKMKGMKMELIPV